MDSIITTRPVEIEPWSRVIVVDGDPPLSGWRRLIAPTASVIAADGGARHARSELVEVTDVIGDLDSLTGDEVEALARDGARIHRFDRDKDFTDFELAARYVARQTSTFRSFDVGQAPPRLLVVGGAGGRLDHALGNIAVLGGPDLAGFAVTALLGDAVVRVAGPQHPVSLDDRPGRCISLLPTSGVVHGVTTRGLRYELDAEDLDATRTRGISNVVESTTAAVSVLRGRLLVIEPDAVSTLIDPPPGGNP